MLQEKANSVHVRFHAYIFYMKNIIFISVYQQGSEKGKKIFDINSSVYMNVCKLFISFVEIKY